VGWTLNQLGDNARAQNDLATARAFFEESADAFQLCGDRDGVAGARGQLADVSNQEGDLATARRLMNEVTAIERELGDNRAHPHRRFQLAQLEVSEGQFSAAHRHFAEGLRGFTSTGDLVGILLSLLGFAWLAEAQGQWQRVVTLLACEEAQRQSLKWPPALQWETVRTRALTSAREALGDEVFEKTWQAGQAMTIEQISACSGIVLFNSNSLQRNSVVSPLVERVRHERKLPEAVSKTNSKLLSSFVTVNRSGSPFEMRGETLNSIPALRLNSIVPQAINENPVAISGSPNGCSFSLHTFLAGSKLRITLPSFT
jgi:hypothetical protein